MLYTKTILPFLHQKLFDNHCVPIITNISMTCRLQHQPMLLTHGVACGKKMHHFIFAQFCQTSLNFDQFRHIHTLINFLSYVFYTFFRKQKAGNQDNICIVSLSADEISCSDHSFISVKKLKKIMKIILKTFANIKWQKIK